MGAFLGRVEVEDATDGVPQAMDSPFGRFSQVRLQLGEGLLDWIEVGAVGWKEEERCADALDGGSHGRRLVARQVVHHDDVAAPEFRHEHASDVGEERVSVHRPVEHPGCHHAGTAQAGCKGGGLPVPKGDARAEPLTAPTAAVPPRHVGAGPGLVDEDQLVSTAL